MPEVSGGGACFVDPYDVCLIRENVVKVLSDSELRVDLINRGFANAEKYKPSVVAGKYLKIYRRMEAMAFDFE